jgi:hypothetical protein
MYSYEDRLRAVRLYIEMRERVGQALLDERNRGIEYEQRRDNTRLQQLAKEQLECDCQLEHPRHGCPELQRESPPSRRRWGNNVFGPNSASSRRASTWLKPESERSGARTGSSSRGVADRALIGSYERSSR